MEFDSSNKENRDKRKHTKVYLHNDRLIRLTPRESQMISLIMAGCYTRKQLASAMALSVHTVDCHLQNIYKKFDVHSKTALILSVWQMQPDKKGVKV